MIYRLTEGSSGRLEKVAEYSLSPKKALVAFIKQSIEGDMQTWRYPEEIAGMRESQTVPDHWYFDHFAKDATDRNYVLASYPVPEG